MPLEDLSDPSRFIRKMRKDIKRSPVRGATGDSGHEGAGLDSVQLGGNTNASGDRSTSIGRSAWSTADSATAVGYNTAADGGDSLALGSSAATAHASSAAIAHNATTTASFQIMLGTVDHTVVVPGTFSNPSARRLKCNVTPAPALSGIFPTVYEWEYIDGDGRRRIGPMADDLVGTDGERFLTFDDDGEVLGLDKCSLHTVQITAMHEELVAMRAELVALREELRSKNG